MLEERFTGCEKLTHSLMSKGDNDLVVAGIQYVRFDDDHMLVRREPMVLYAKKSDCGDYWNAVYEDFDSQISAAVPEDLRCIFESVLRKSWDLYILGNPTELTEGALKLRNHLSETYSLVAREQFLESL